MSHVFDILESLPVPDFRVGSQAPQQHMAFHQIALVLMVTNCSINYSISKLKLIEIRLQTSITH